MLLIAVSYRRCGRNLQAKLDTVINSLSANHAYLKTLYTGVPVTHGQRDARPTYIRLSTQLTPVLIAPAHGGMARLGLPGWPVTY